jgi:hypothetical protein
LLNHWFRTEHLLPQADGSIRPFRWYFAQWEAVESAIWLYEVEGARDPYSLLKYDSSGRVSKGMFPEHWTRYVMKLARGAGKTKVMSLLIAWCYFHKRYEEGSDLSTNFLLVTPNIIVLDRLRVNFDGLKIFHHTDAFIAFVESIKVEGVWWATATSSWSSLRSSMAATTSCPSSRIPKAHFRIEYRNVDGAIANYIPDFIIKRTDGEIWIVETKGREDLTDLAKWERLRQWCKDASARDEARSFRALYVKQEDWEAHPPRRFRSWSWRLRPYRGPAPATPASPRRCRGAFRGCGRTCPAGSRPRPSGWRAAARSGPR